MPLRAFALAILAAAAVGCAAFTEYVTPPAGPGTEWPCGYHNTVCEDGTCCGYREQCKAANQTHADPYCEYTGPEDMGPADTFGASRERPRFARSH
jgi:hypothetical protein